MLRYEVKDVVCDYGLYENNELKLILNSRDNALLIKEIMEADKKGNNFRSVLPNIIESVEIAIICDPIFYEV